MHSLQKKDVPPEFSTLISGKSLHVTYIQNAIMGKVSCATSSGRCCYVCTALYDMKETVEQKVSKKKEHIVLVLMSGK